MTQATSILKGKAVLVVDDEPDILDTVEEVLDMCMVYKAPDYNSAIQLLLGFTYDIVILDIMGVNGFELLKIAVRRGFPTVMLTAHALTTEALKNSIKLGAVSCLPKDKIHELPIFLKMSFWAVEGLCGKNCLITSNLTLTSASEKIGK